MKAGTMRTSATIGMIGLAFVMATSCAGAADKPSTGTTEEPAVASAATPLRTPPVPSGVAASDRFSVKARPPGGSWRDVGVYAVKVDLEDPSTVAMAVLEAGGPVEIAVTRLAGPMRSVRVRPSAIGVRTSLSGDGRTATFTLRRPRNLSIEPNGDTHANLHLFVNPIDRGVPAARRGKRVIRYRAGVHEVPGDHVIRPPSHSTVQLDAGAVVHGTIRIVGARDVVVRGSGVIDGSPYFDKLDGPIGVFVDGSSDVGIQGITILRGQNGGVGLSDASDVVVQNVKQINADEWSDGIDIAGSRDVLVDGCFFRTSDDSVAIWATAQYIGSRSTSSVTVRNSVLWPDLAHAVLVGPFGAPQRGESVSGVDFQNVDVLEQKEDNPLYQGALAVNAGANLTVRDVRFEDVRIDRITQGQALNVRVFDNTDYDTGPGKEVRNVLFRDVTLPSDEDEQSVVSGWSDGQKVSDVAFENVGPGGASARGDARDANVDVGAYTSGVTFEPRLRFATWDDRSPELAYSRGWLRRRMAGSHYRDVHRSRTPGASAVAGFSGRQARLRGPIGPGGGKLDVYVDGTYVRTVDTYAGRYAAMQVLFDSGPLAPGEHTLEVRATGDRNVLSRSALVSVDVVEIVR